MGAAAAGGRRRHRRQIESKIVLAKLHTRHLFAVIKYGAGVRRTISLVIIQLILILFAFRQLSISFQLTGRRQLLAEGELKPRYLAHNRFLLCFIRECPRVSPFGRNWTILNFKLRLSRVVSSGDNM